MKECVICMEETDHLPLMCHDTHVVCGKCMPSLAKTSDLCPVCRADTVMVERFRHKLPMKESETTPEPTDDSFYVVESQNGTMVNFDSLEEAQDYLMFSLGWLIPEDAMSFSSAFHGFLCALALMRRKAL